MQADGVHHCLTNPGPAVLPVVNLDEIWEWLHRFESFRQDESVIHTMSAVITVLPLDNASIILRRTALPTTPTTGRMLCRLRWQYSSLK